MAVDQASAFEQTLERIRERYALYFYLPEGMQPGEEHSVEVLLTDAARRRLPWRGGSLPALIPCAEWRERDRARASHPLIHLAMPKRRPGGLARAARLSGSLDIDYAPVFT